MKSNQRATIETLLERNTSQREIARITGIDRKTVRSYHQRWLEQLQSNSPGVANQVAQRTAMDKVAVSRAVAKLLDTGRLLREFDEDDRRRSVLRLSEAGYAIYDQIVPLALGFERQLLGDMDATERALLFRLLDRLDELELRAEAEATHAAG